MEQPAALTPAERRAVTDAVAAVFLAAAYWVYVARSNPTRGEVVFASAAFFLLRFLLTAIRNTLD